MSRKSEGVKKWRQSTKNRIVEAFGGRCCVCEYSRCNDVLVLHHLDYTQKEYSLGGLRASIRSWNTIVKELRKCVMVCANCHGEIHQGLVALDNLKQLNIINCDKLSIWLNKEWENI